MAMTIGAIPAEMDKIARELDAKGVFDTARKIRDMRTRMMGIGATPSAENLYHPPPMPGVTEPMPLMEYMYPKVNEIVRKIGKNNFDLLMDTIGHSDNPEKLVKTIIAGMPLGGEPNMTRLQQTMHHEQIELDRVIGELQGVRQRLTAESYTGPRAPSYAAPIPATPQLKKIRRY